LLTAGGGGLDKVTGGAGADTLIAGSSSSHGDSLNGAAGADIIKFSTASLVATPTVGQIHILGGFVTGTGHIEFQPLTSGFTVTQATDTVSDDTITNVLALNSTANSVDVIHMTASDGGSGTETGFTNIGGLGVTMSAGDYVSVVNDGTHKYLIYTGTAHPVSADFMIYS